MVTGRVCREVTIKAGVFERVVMVGASALVV